MTTDDEPQQVLVRLRPDVDYDDLLSQGIEFEHLIKNHYSAVLTSQQIAIARKHPAVESVFASKAKFITAEVKP